MKSWENRALALIDKSLGTLPSEYNELDWKSGLSDNSEKLAKHISAFSHLSNGGFLIFGINNDGTFCAQLEKLEIDRITRVLGNIAENNLSQRVTIDYTIINYKGHDLLSVFIPESNIKPVNLRGADIFDCYKRTAGRTIKMSADEVRYIIAQSQNISFEEQIALSAVRDEDVLSLLDYESFFRLLSRNVSANKTANLNLLSNDGLIKENPDNSWNITNLGAILFAKDIKKFKTIQRKSIRVIAYSGTNKVTTIKEVNGRLGYASAFEKLIKYINNLFPTNEIIEDALRKQVKMYPEEAIRELVANALIHQDFSIKGAGVMIEAYSDRIEITNPGTPLVDTNRFIDTAPKSRNEILAALLRRLNICEERGSGIKRVVSLSEVWQLPAPKFIREEDYTRIILYAHKKLTQMGKEDRIRACYQHCCLQHVSNQITNNQSVRKRFNITEANYPMASRIIADTIDAGWIKLSDPKSKSKKHATYIPFWS